jgi:hypothetical protein
MKGRARAAPVVSRQNPFPAGPTAADFVALRARLAALRLRREYVAGR